MHQLNFKSCQADPDVWMDAAMKADASPVYDCVLFYINNMLVISENSEHMLHNKLGCYFHLKEELDGQLTLYLGDHVRMAQLDNGMEAWASAHPSICRLQ